MNSYQVHVKGNAGAVLTVEANTAFDAIEKALAETERSLGPWVVQDPRVTYLFEEARPGRAT